MEPNSRGRVDERNEVFGARKPLFWAVVHHVCWVYVTKKPKNQSPKQIPNSKPKPKNRKTKTTHFLKVQTSLQESAGNETLSHLKMEFEAFWKGRFSLASKAKRNEVFLLLVIFLSLFIYLCIYLFICLFVCLFIITLFFLLYIYFF